MNKDTLYSKLERNIMGGEQLRASYGHYRLTENGLSYHGNQVVTIDRVDNKVILDDCGWRTNTTKGIINETMRIMGLSDKIRQKDYEWGIWDNINAVRREVWGGARSYNL